MPKSPSRHFSISDIRGIAQLAADATVGVTHIVEGVHQSVWRTLGLPGGQRPDQARGLARLVYQSIRGVTRLVGVSAEALLPALESVFGQSDHPPSSAQREAVLAALNGVMGDRLAAADSPFVTEMSLRDSEGELVQPPPGGTALPSSREASGKVVLLVHGLCMNDRQWRSDQNGTDHGQRLARQLGYMPIYLRYNSGLHVSQNGRQLAALLDEWIEDWPVPITELAIVGHSMGGLVARGAVHYAEQGGSPWRKRLKHLVFLGTPHHGAPLERAGSWVDTLLGANRYTAPFARLGHLRSAGITDLRYGHVLDEDWQGRNRFERQADARSYVALPDGVACYAVAATTAEAGEVVAAASGLPRGGDGLVPVSSALGCHQHAERTLRFAKDSQFIVPATGHLALLSSPVVGDQLIKWLGCTE